MIGAPVALPLLFAAGFDWLEAILPILFVGFWILSQVFAVFRRVAGGPVRPPAPRVPDAAREAAPPPLPAGRPELDPRAELDQQIADFLRQVTGEPPAAKPSRAPVQPPSRSPPQPQRSGPPAPRPKPVPPVAAPAAERRQPVGERHVGTLDVQPSTVARHVHDAFDHQLGQLHSGLERPAEAAASTEAARRAAGSLVIARDLVAAARNPATIRQAMLLREILERPADRW
jgi:hypothetical protein